MEDYSAGKQTAAQLAAQHGCSCKTIYRHLRRARIRETFPQPAKANIIMDTTYFGRGFGVMVLMDSISGQALSVREVKHETNALYAEALNALREKGVVIQIYAQVTDKKISEDMDRLIRKQQTASV